MDFVLVFCVNFETSTKTNLEVKILVIPGRKQERGIMHSVYPAVRQPGITITWHSMTLSSVSQVVYISSTALLRLSNKYDQYLARKSIFFLLAEFDRLRASLVFGFSLPGEHALFSFFFSSLLSLSALVDRVLRSFLTVKIRTPFISSVSCKFHVNVFFYFLVLHKMHFQNSPVDIQNWPVSKAIYKIINNS